MNDRPIGVKILATLSWLAGMWSICIGAFALGAFSAGSLGNVVGLVEPEGVGLVSLFNLIWGIITFFLGFGLWRYKSWARLAMIVIQGINLLFLVVTLFTPDPVNWFSGLISVVIIGYLLQPRIKTVFD